MERVWLKIGETASRLGVKPKVLRYWEQVIPEICARRSKGNLRYYHVDELDRLARIRNWLEEGLTVADCRELLLTGQLARGLDLGLGDLAPAPRGKAARKKTRPAPRRPDVAKVAAALRRLLGQLGQPVKR
jgi:DNA-binding transcriptional MerR regulator